MHKLIAMSLMFSMVPAYAADVPVADRGAWKNLSYSSIPPNEVSVSDGALLIAVNESASPLIHGFDEPRVLTGITIVATYSGGLRIPDDATQGDGNADDFVLKAGVVESGEQTLNWLQRRIAADWIKRLHELAPEDSGIRRINFLSTTQSRALLGTSRTHPLSDLLYEQRLTLVEAPGEFRITHRFPEPVEALGLWLSSDGDDTNSSFEVRIEKITLQTD